MLHKKTIQVLNLIVIMLLVLPFFFNSTITGYQTDSNFVCQSIDYSCIISSHSVTINLEGIDDISVEEEFIIKNNSSDPMEGVSLWLNQSFADLTIVDSSGSLEYSFINETNLISIDFATNIITDQLTFVKISYNLDRTMTKAGSDPSYFLFSFVPSMTYYTQLQEISVTLPSTCDIYYGGYPIDIHPDTSPPIGVGDQKLKITWFFTDLAPFNEEHFIFVCFTEPIAPPLVWPFVIGPILGLAAGVTGTIWLMRRREKRTIKKIGSIFLNDNQKRFLEIIIENGGKISQKELTTITGYTKNKVSRNLISLEQQQLIIREKWGRNYRIFITETGERVAK
jgi:hypothetical protein